MSSTTSDFSLVLETPAARPEDAQRHFLAKLSVETDAAMLLVLEGQRCFPKPCKIAQVHIDTIPNRTR